MSGLPPQESLVDVLEVLEVVLFGDLLETEDVPEDLATVFGLVVVEIDVLEEKSEVLEFRVSLVGVEGEDREAIVDLQAIGVGRVVDQDHVAESAVADHAEVFDVYLAVEEGAVVAVQAVADHVAVGVQVVQDLEISSTDAIPCRRTEGGWL